jgi:short-subunit dehydrogenase
VNKEGENRMNLERKIAAVTGAGSGIGRQVAIQLARKNVTIAAMDINPDTLQETISLIAEFSGQCSSYVVNIADQDRVFKLPEEIIANHGAIDILINNAGIIQAFMTVSALSLAQIERVFDVNWFGTLYMTKAFLPYLRQRPEAYLVNVSSMGAFVPVPGQVIYGASKAAIQLLTEGLISELHDTPVKVAVVFPGAVATNIAQNAPDISKDDLKQLGGSTRSSQPTGTSAEEAGRQIVQMLERNQQRLYIGSDSRMMNFLSRLSPKFAANTIRTQLQKMVGPIKDA